MANANDMGETVCNLVINAKDITAKNQLQNSCYWVTKVNSRNQITKCFAAFSSDWRSFATFFSKVIVIRGRKKYNIFLIFVILKP
jgi:hypothetical protein